jgi:hypothetical protein
MIIEGRYSKEAKNRWRHFLGPEADQAPIYSSSDSDNEESENDDYIDELINNYSSYSLNCFLKPIFILFE